MKKKKSSIENNSSSSNFSKLFKNAKNIIYIFTLMLGIIYFGLSIKNAFSHINYVLEIINSSLILCSIISIALVVMGNKKIRNIFSLLLALFIISIILLNLLVGKNIITLPTLTVMQNLKNTTLIDTMKWADENNIIINTTYEYSDNYKEGYIIDQDVLPNSLIKDIKEINVTVSSGPNYDKEVIVSNMSGMTIDDLLSFINKNHLNNVSINYEFNDETSKDTIVSQNIKGQVKRNEAISFIISLGSKDNLTSIVIENLVNKTEFDATLYLKKNGINYNLSYEFSNKIKRGSIISQNIEKGKSINPLSDTINLVVSKGKEIIVPNFKEKNVNDVIEWIVNNNLKVSFSETYDLNIPSGDLININYNHNDVIEEETKIIITTSKGPLTVPTFNSLAEFINWASTNGIRYSQEYQYNNNVSKGNIISLSIPSGQKIDPTKDSIIVTISYGAPVTVPNFVGKSKSNITSTCRSVGLNCTFYYTGYSNASFDTATTQNVGAGSKVVSGTYVRIGLSNGPAKTYNIYIQAEWYQSSADATINVIRNNLNSSCPGVTFNFIKKADNSSPSGFIHPNSPIKGGNNTFTQGQTYTIWIVE